MDPGVGWVIPLKEAVDCEERWIGGKAAKLAHLAQTGFRVPGGFFITTKAYKYFLENQDLARLIHMELGRKSFTSMRWEEIWGVALRIRSAFLATPIPQALAQAIAAAVEDLGAGKSLAVRSSAPGEDSANRSFAGLHESVVGVVGTDAVLDAVRVVWASLWSDAALLYRQELALDPALSLMAVVVQEVNNHRQRRWLGMKHLEDALFPGTQADNLFPVPTGSLAQGCTCHQSGCIVQAR